MKKLVLFPAIFGLLLSGCSLEDLMFWKKNSDTPSQKEDEDKGDTTVHVSSVSLNKSSTSIVEDSSETLSCTVLPENASNKAVTWSTSNSDVASVANGVVRGVSAGTATITVASVDGNKTATCAVTVTEKQAPEVHVTSVSLNKGQLSLEEMQSETLTYTIYPSNATNKNVEWSTSDATVATVVEGTVYAVNPGTATISVTTVDGNKTSSCDVTVSEKAIEIETVTKTINFNTYCKDVLGYTSTQYDITEPAVVDENVSITFTKNEGTQPRYIKGNNTNKYEARAYAKNTFSIDCSTANITEISFAFSNDKPGDNPLIPDVGEFENDIWTGKSKSVCFTVGGESEHRRIAEISVTYEGSEPTEEDINLGVKTIAEVKEYIAEHPVPKNSFGNGVNKHRRVTIQGFALAKIDLVKTTSTFGLDVTERGRVIMGDETGVIGAATATSKEGTCLWGKVGDYVCKETSKYVVTGYLSEVLGNPEILVISFSYEKDLDLSWSETVASSNEIDLDEFYSEAVNMNYNCAGHGYGEVVTIKDLKCYYHESDGQEAKYYNFTDGTKNIRVNAYNLSSVSEGSVYNVTGIISMKNLSPIIVAFKIESSETPVFDFNYEDEAVETSIEDLRKICGLQEDTSERFDDVVECFGKVYKTSGYMCVVNEGTKEYVGISDVYYPNNLSGKDKASTQYNVALIKNDYFWNITPGNYHDSFEQYIKQDQKIDVYYVVRQQRFSEKEAIWEILLIPDFINSVMVY